MKKLLVFILLEAICLIPANAVLKEKDLARTLGVLKAELQEKYEQQQTFMAMYEQQGTQQHLQLVSYMHQCEQIGLMLYSQTTDNTFDMAYACQQATDLFNDLNNRDSKMRQYDKIILRIKQEIERYDALIQSLKSMPPVDAADADSILTENDSILMQAIDSLQGKKDSLLEVRDSMQEKNLILLGQEEAEEEEDKQEPLFLSGQQLKDRADCLKYAETLRENMQRFLEKLEAENTYYKSVVGKVEELNLFARGRYKLLQDNIFINGGDNYFKILKTLPVQILRAQNTLKTKYKPFEGHEQTYSEWRGAPVLFISIFLVFYLAISLLVSYVVLRWLLPKKWRSDAFKLKRRMLNNVVGIALFAVIVMIVRSSIQRNFIQMGTAQIINMAWLMEVIFLSLYIRLKGEQMRHAAVIYLPLMSLSFVVILFRIVLIPNLVVNLIFPPILLGFSIWQWKVSKKHREQLPMLDIMYMHATSLVMIIACIASWVGFSLLAVQIMIWWTFQLAAIMTVTCIYDLMEMYEERHLLSKLRTDLKEKKANGEDISDELKTLKKKMQRGDYISVTWIYDLFKLTLVPIFGVASVFFSIYWASKVFEMTSLCESFFRMDIVHQQNLIRISLDRLCLVAALWFVFRYLNYGIRGFYCHYRRKLLSENETLNLTLARNIIGILCWGIYIIIVLVILDVPRDGISIVGAGLATGLGFAMQSILENFFYGISLMTGRIHVGDYIECDGIAGKVESITYQSTQIVTNDGCVIAFMNSALFRKNFKNMTRNHRYELIKIPVGVAYGSNVEEVRKMIIEALMPVCLEKNADGQCITNVEEQPMTVAFVNFGDSSVDLAVCIWMLVEEKIVLVGRVKEIIYNTLNKNNIEIPFPQRDVHIKNS
ncbi:MAG: mechanosensitive ion channel family protein [Bacteroidaceae bacterium]|nr:mechanosensitive ion channel family protein [Bacteroidaceae bacterium]